MMRCVVCLVLALHLAGCVTASTRPETLQQTWDSAHVRLLHGDIAPFGLLKAPINQQKLAGLPAGLRFPTVIYLHGCAGLDLEHASRTMGLLLRQGFAVIAPDSFALGRKQACGSGNRTVWFARAAEAAYAAERARELPWVDGGNLFLVGHSEGAAGVAAYGGPHFNALVISGFGCNDGIASRTPSLAVAANDDPQITGVGSICPSATQRMILPGVEHHMLRKEDVAERVAAFLLANLKR